MIKVTIESDGAKGTSECDGMTLEEVLECTEQAIYACGFRFKGYLDFQEEL